MKKLDVVVTQKMVQALRQQVQEEKDAIAKHYKSIAVYEEQIKEAQRIGWVGILTLNENGSVCDEGAFGRHGPVTGIDPIYGMGEKMRIDLQVEGDTCFNRTWPYSPRINCTPGTEYWNTSYSYSYPDQLHAKRHPYLFAIFDDKAAAKSYVTRRCVELKQREDMLKKLVNQVEAAVLTCPFCGRQLKLASEHSVIVEPDRPRFYLWNPYPKARQCECTKDCGLYLRNNPERAAAKALMAVLNELRAYAESIYDSSIKKWRYKKESIEIPTRLEIGTVYVGEVPLASLSAYLHNWRKPRYSLTNTYWQFVVEATIPEDATLLDRTSHYLENTELLQHVANRDYAGLELFTPSEYSSAS